MTQSHQQAITCKELGPCESTSSSTRIARRLTYHLDPLDVRSGDGERGVREECAQSRHRSAHISLMMTVAHCFKRELCVGGDAASDERK